MNENIVIQVVSVIDKYKKNYSQSGVMDNLRAWEASKPPLINMLRKHPNWNEDALAVIFEITHSREIERHVVNSNSHSVLQLGSDLNMAYEDSVNFQYSLNAATNTCTKQLYDESTVANILMHSGVSCAVGQKTSRAINKICQRYNLEKHPEYNARFARLADSLNPLQVKRTALLSVHPCDYLEMSNEINSWSSCHCLDKGEYRAGTISYMNDAVSLIFYTIDDDFDDGDYYSAPKRTRQVFSYSDGILLQSRLYPQTNDEEAREIYRNIVQMAIAECLDIPNLWVLKKSQNDVEHYCCTHEESLHYQDYVHSCNRANVSLLKSVHADDYSNIVIGSRGYCLDCSQLLSETSSLHCDNCNNVGGVICYECGRRVHEDDASYINGADYCNDCSDYCNWCQHYVLGEATIAYDQQGQMVRVCDRCRDEDFYYCDTCEGYFHRDHGENIEDELHCRECIEGFYYKCSCCEEYVRHGDAKEMEDLFYCDSCFDDAISEVETECLRTA